MTSRKASQTACVSGCRLSVLARPFPVIIADQMGQDLGVRAGPEFMAGIEQFLFEPVVILDDAVVDDRNPAGLVEVRMGIDVGRRAVSGPARVANAEIPATGSDFSRRARPSSILPILLADEQFATVQDSDAGAVVAAIFQPPQTLEEDGRDRFLTDVSNDAAHIFKR